MGVLILYCGGFAAAKIRCGRTTYGVSCMLASSAAALDVSFCNIRDTDHLKSQHSHGWDAEAQRLDHSVRS